MPRRTLVDRRRPPPARPHARRGVGDTRLNQDPSDDESGSPADRTRTRTRRTLPTAPTGHARRSRRCHPHARQESLVRSPRRCPDWRHDVPGATGPSRCPCLATRRACRRGGATPRDLDDGSEDPAEVEAAWAAEIEQRARRVMDGGPAGTSWQDVRSRADEGVVPRREPVGLRLAGAPTAQIGLLDSVSRWTKPNPSPSRVDLRCIFIGEEAP